MIKKLTQQELNDPVTLANAKDRIVRSVRGWGPAPKFNREAYAGKQRHANNLIKKMLRGRSESWTPPVIDTDMLVARYRDNAALDTLYPERPDAWISPLKRRKKSEFTLRQFSFLNHPNETIEALRAIALLDATQARYLIHFELAQCEDVSPFIVLGLMREGMTPAASGGRLSPDVAQMMKAVGVDRFLKMRVLETWPPPTGQLPIWPLPLQSKEPRQSHAQSQAYTAQRKEKVTDIFVEAINHWLFQAGDDNCRFTLTRSGMATIAEIFSELLDNAERHTIVGDDRGGGWRVAGFMAKKRVGDRDEFVCNISIVSAGVTIGQSLANAEDPEVKRKLDQYCARHRLRFGGNTDAEDLLRTVCAIQDRVSRVAQTEGNPAGGVGLMDMIDVVNELGVARPEAPQPQVTIYSGNSCILVSGTYRRGKGNAADVTAPRTLWFNPRNRLEDPPDSAHVFVGAQRFPGTIVTARFCIDEKYLADVGEGADADN